MSHLIDTQADTDRAVCRRYDGLSACQWAAMFRQADGDSALFQMAASHQGHRACAAEAQRDYWRRQWYWERRARAGWAALALVAGAVLGIGATLAGVLLAK